MMVTAPCPAARVGSLLRVCVDRLTWVRSLAGFGDKDLEELEKQRYTGNLHFTVVETSFVLLGPSQKKRNQEGAKSTTHHELSARIFKELQNESLLPYAALCCLCLNRVCAGFLRARTPFCDA